MSWDRTIGLPHRSIQYFTFLFDRGGDKKNLQQEPVGLGFGQDGPLLFNWILGRQHQERLRQRVGFRADGDDAPAWLPKGHPLLLGPD